MEEACGVVMALIIGFVCYAVAVIYTCRPTGANHAEKQKTKKDSTSPSRGENVSSNASYR